MAEEKKPDEGKQEAKAADTSVTQPTTPPPQQPPAGTDTGKTGNDPKPAQPILVRLVGGDDLEPFEEQSLAISRETLTISKRTYWIAIFGFLAAVAAASFVGVQVEEMSDQTQILASQSESAAAGAAIGERDTRRQLEIAQQQTTALNKQVTAMNRQLALSTATQIPVVFLKEMPQQTEDLHGDSIVKWSGVWHNSGGSKPIGLKVWNDCTDFTTPTPIKFHRQVAPLFSLVLGPGVDRTVTGCEALYSYLKQIDDENIVRAQARDDTRRQFYVFGGANYKDFLGHRHIVEYCYQLWWDNRSLKFGFQLIPCFKPNDQYNCTDEECKDWNQNTN